LSHRAQAGAIGEEGLSMRAAGLLALLAGSIILMLPVFSQLLHRSWAVADDSLIGGALLCLGIAAVMISRKPS
jgi:hypothetical protein